MTREELIQEVNKLRSRKGETKGKGTRYSFEEIRDLFERVPVGLYKSSPTGKILDVNSSLLRILGYNDVESIRDLNTSDLYNDPEDHKRWIRSVTEKGIIQNFEVEIKRGDGETIWVNDNTRTIYDEDGEVRFYEGAIFDITEEKKLRDALRESEERFRDLVDKSRAAIALDDSEGRIIYCNDRYSELFGYDTEELKGMGIFDLIDPSDVSRIRDIHSDRYQGGEGKKRYEFRGLNKDGSVMWLQVDVVEIIVDGKLRRTQAYIWDVTELKETEAKVKSLNDLLKLMNKVLRHDIGNNLTAAVTAIEWYKKKREEKTLDITEKSVKRCMDTISEMRALETLLTSGSDLQSRPLRSLIRSTSEHQPVKVDIRGDCKALVDEGFPTVIDNLIGNAVEHGKSEKVTIDISSEDKECVIRIADDGTGIPDEIKERVFQEGFRDSSSSGSGLGLFIVYNTIQRYGGGIHVEDNIPHGAVFVIRLRKEK